MNATTKLTNIMTVNPEAISYVYGPQNEIRYNLETNTVRVFIVNDGHDEQHIEKALTELQKRGILSNIEESDKINAVISAMKECQEHEEIIYSF